MRGRWQLVSRSFAWCRRSRRVPQAPPLAPAGVPGVVPAPRLAPPAACNLAAIPAVISPEALAALAVLLRPSPNAAGMIRLAAVPRSLGLGHLVQSLHRHSRLGCQE